MLIQIAAGSFLLLSFLLSSWIWVGIWNRLWLADVSKRRVITLSLVSFYGLGTASLGRVDAPYWIQYAVGFAVGGVFVFMDSRSSASAARSRAAMWFWAAGQVLLPTLILISGILVGSALVMAWVKVAQSS